MYPPLNAPPLGLSNLNAMRNLGARPVSGTPAYPAPGALAPIAPWGGQPPIASPVGPYPVRPITPPVSGVPASPVGAQPGAPPVTGTPAYPVAPIPVSGTPAFPAPGAPPANGTPAYPVGGGAPPVAPVGPAQPGGGNQDWLNALQNMLQQSRGGQPPVQSGPQRPLTPQY
jgi:hypothetical protein